MIKVRVPNALGRIGLLLLPRACFCACTLTDTCSPVRLPVQDLKTVIMINCGATDDVRGMCDLSDNVRLIIVDSHRPIWHGYNTEVGPIAG